MATDDMVVVADKRARPMLWLVGASLVCVLYSWYPEAIDRSIPDELDSRIWMMYPALAPYVLAAFLVAIVAYCFLVRAAKRQFDAWSILLLVLGLPLLYLVVVPGWLVIRVYLAVWFSHDAA